MTGEQLGLMDQDESEAALVLRRQAAVLRSVDHSLPGWRYAMDAAQACEDRALSLEKSA